MQVLANIGSLVTSAQEGEQGAIHTIRDAALVWEGDTVQWVGPQAALPAAFEQAERTDAHGMLVLPGLVDCHTHLAFGGWRTDEFEMRALGRPYLEIAKAGGGIASSVSSTRTASEDALYHKAFGFLDEMMALGITTVECKTGYGLTLEDELKVLRVYRRLAAEHPVRVRATLLAAHIVPAEFRENRRGYIDLIVKDILPAVAAEALASFCDVFVEETAFLPEEAVEICTAAARHGLRAKLHVDQLHDGGGAALAARLNAISADHLEYASPEGIGAMAEAGVVAVSLPFASFNLRQPAMQARAFIDAGVPVAVATDFNPGSAPSYHLPAAMYMACIMQYMSPAEVVKGATHYAAKALGMENTVGTLTPGFKADFVAVDAPDVNHWMGHFRPNAACLTCIDGRVVHRAGVFAELQRGTTA
ncbi:MAG: imidazolonepropionase [Bacteroidota bacterium]